MTLESTTTLTFSQISRKTFVHHADLNTVAVSRSHVSRVCRGRVEASPKVGRAIAHALTVNYYDWLRSVQLNQERFQTFIRRSTWPDRYDLCEFLDLLDVGLRVVNGPNGGFEILCRKGYKYGDSSCFHITDAKEELDDHLAVLQQCSN